MGIRVLVRAAVCVGAVVIALPSAARAGTIRLDTDFTGLNVHYQLGGVLAEPITNGSVTMSNGAGLTDALNAPNSFEAYCVDIFTDVLDPASGLPAAGGTYTAEADLMSNWTDPTGHVSPVDGSVRAAWLYNEYAAAFAATNNMQDRTALQLAIWDVLYDTDFSVTTSDSDGTGTFSISLQYTDYSSGLPGTVKDLDPNDSAQKAQIDSYNAIAIRANQLLAAVQIADLTGVDAAWLRLTVPGSTVEAQDFIGPSSQSVPEPSSMVLLGTGFAAVFVFRSRKLRRS